MRHDGRPFTAVILAAQRAGAIDPLATGAGVSHKCLVPIGGVPMIARVASVLAATPGVDRIRIVVEPDAVPAIEATLPAGGVRIDYVPAAANLTDSVHLACSGVDGLIAVTTADNVLLTPGAVQSVLAPLGGAADVTLAMARQAAVQAAHPDGQRRFYRFADDAYSNCNLYAFGNARALAAAESFRSGGQFAKKPLRLIAFAGPINLALMLLGRLTLAGAMTRLGRRFKLRIVPVVLDDGAHAIDVDNRRTYDVASLLIGSRAVPA